MPEWQSINETDVEAAIKNPQYIHKSKCGCNYPIFTFRHIDEHIEGLIVPCPSHDRADRARCAHIISYTDSETQKITAIRMSKMIWQAIDGETNTKPKYWRRYVRITYIGNIATRFGHAQKIYRVEVNNGTLRDAYEQVETKTKKDSRPRERRPMARPGNIQEQDDI